MDVLVPLPVSVKIFWGCPLPSPFLSHLEGRRLHSLSSLHKEVCNSPCFRLLLKSSFSFMGEWSGLKNVKNSGGF